LNSTVIPYATTTYTDYGDVGHEQTADDLIGRNEVMEADHDAPPNVRVLGGPYNDRLLLASSDEFPNRVWYTKAAQPAFVPGDQWVDVGADRGDAVLGLSIKKGYFVIYRQRSIWWHVGDFDDANAKLEPLVPEMGTVGLRSWCTTTKGDFYAWNDGIYRLGDWADKISKKIEPVLIEPGAENYEAANIFQRSQQALGYNDGRLWVSYADAENETNTQCFIYDVQTDRWFSRIGGFSCFYRGLHYWYGGDELGNVQSVEDGLTKGTQGDGLGNELPFQMAYQSAYQDCGFPDHEKTWGDLVIDHNTQGVDLDVTVRWNKNRLTSAFIRVATINSNVLTRQVIPLVYPQDWPVVILRGLAIRTRNLSIRIEGLGPTGGFAYIDTPILLHYYLEARGGKAFDSGITNHGMPEVKKIDQVEIDIDAPSLVSLQVWSDIPGGQVLVRQADSTQTDGREVVVLVLEEPVEGKLLRYQLASLEEHQVYGFRARVLPIGVYVDGAQGETWISEPLTAGA